MIKWTEQDVIDAVDKAIADTPQGGNNQLLQQLREKSRQIEGRVAKPFGITKETK